MIDNVHQKREWVRKKDRSVHQIWKAETRIENDPKEQRERPI